MAYLRMELVEHLCRIALAARQAGGLRPLSPQMLRPLLDARARAGLGPEARGGSTTVPAAQEPSETTRADLEQVVREEIRRTLG